ncbi:hypothetical protein GCM10022631_26090 [Deinococcus rubellus]|uniref:glyoxalase superfamily protein n=1 Tax=Deinococcus rubellus TaxID=1889240 RepID=UPI0031E7A4D4
MLPAARALTGMVKVSLLRLHLIHSVGEVVGNAGTDGRFAEYEEWFMTTHKQAKAMAKRLRAALAASGTDIPHAQALELVASQLGYANWNVAAAALDSDPEGKIHFRRAIPILRIFDGAKAREFYCDFLGFGVDFEHRFEPALPLYMQVSRLGLELHLSEHHGDASPGATVFVPMQGVRALWQELNEKQYSYGRPGIKTQPWGNVLTVHDPFGNRLQFCQAHDSQLQSNDFTPNGIPVAMKREVGF